MIGFALVVNYISESVIFGLSRTSVYTSFFGKVDRIKAEMEMLKVPIDLQYRVDRYYDYLWMNQKMGLSDDSAGVLRDPDLSVPLRKELALRIHGPLLSNLAIFSSCSPDCMFAIAMRLKTHVYLPGDVVFYKGDVARELFIIRRGVIGIRFGEVDQFRTKKTDGFKPTLQKTFTRHDLQLEHDDNFAFRPIAVDDCTVKLMGPGSFFGEISLLTDMPRSCSVFSKTVSELHELSKSDFQECIKEYPELGDQVKQKVLLLYPGVKDIIEQDTHNDNRLPVSMEQLNQVVGLAVEKILAQLNANKDDDGKPSKMHVNDHHGNRVSVADFDK